MALAIGSQASIKDLQTYIAKSTGGIIKPGYQLIYRLVTRGLLPIIPAADVNRVRFRADLLPAIADAVIQKMGVTA